MKSLRLRAILKSVGYKRSFKNQNYNQAIYSRNKNQELVYVDFERDDYNSIMNEHGKNSAARSLFIIAGIIKP